MFPHNEIDSLFRGFRELFLEKSGARGNPSLKPRDSDHPKTPPPCVNITCTNQVEINIGAIQEPVWPMGSEHDFF
jgi:hypothetical protein